jgi:hypothetical protein
MRIVIAKACLAKALRDATFKVVPRALCKPVENEAKRIAIGDAKTLETRRKAMFEWVSKLNVAAERVFAALGVEGEEDIGVDELKILLGLHTAIKDGEVSVDEAFPRTVAKAATPKRLKKEEPTDDGATVPVQQDQQ